MVSRKTQIVFSLIAIAAGVALASLHNSENVPQTQIDRLAQARNNVLALTEPKLCFNQSSSCIERWKKIRAAHQREAEVYKEIAKSASAKVDDNRWVRQKQTDLECENDWKLRSYGSANIVHLDDIMIQYLSRLDKLDAEEKRSYKQHREDYNSLVKPLIILSPWNDKCLP